MTIGSASGGGSAGEGTIAAPAPRAGHVAAAALIPPLGLHLSAARPRDFWICTGLTVLGFVPGVVFALYLVLRRGGATAA